MAWPRLHDSSKPVRAVGMTLIEVTATLAVLAVTGVAIAKWVTIQSRLDQQTEIRLAASLSTQNAAESLRKTTHEDLENAVVELKADASAQGLQFVLSPFQVDAADGLHLRIDAVDKKDASRVLASAHLWRISIPEDDGDPNASE